MTKLLIIDDDFEVSKMIASVLEDEGYEVFSAQNQEDAFEILKNNDFSTIFLDLWFGTDENAGFKILKQIKKLYAKIPVVMISGHGSVDNAVAAIKKGAYDFIEKPFTLDRLLLVTKRSVENFNLKNNLESNNDYLQYLVGDSPEITKVRNSLRKIANSNCRVFIEAGAGSGADSIALFIHNNSSNHLKKFLQIDCKIQSEKDIEETLFGVKYNSRTINSALENEEIGTIYLENVLCLSENLQILLYKFFQSEKSNFAPRIISSSIDLKSDKVISEKLFKEDLFFRLNVVTLEIPKLKNRIEDIPKIVDFFIKNAPIFFEIQSKEIENSVINAFELYSWPGNIKQMRNIIEYALIMAQDSNLITLEHIPDEIKNSKTNQIQSIDYLTSLPIKDARNLFEKKYIEIQVEKFSGQISKISKFIGMERSALHRKIKTLGISTSEERDTDH